MEQILHEQYLWCFTKVDIIHVEGAKHLIYPWSLVVLLPNSGSIFLLSHEFTAAFWPLQIELCVPVSRWNHESRSRIAYGSFRFREFTRCSCSFLKLLVYIGMFFPSRSCCCKIATILGQTGTNAGDIPDMGILPVASRTDRENGQEIDLNMDIGNWTCAGRTYIGRGLTDLDVDRTLRKRRGQRRLWYRILDINLKSRSRRPN